MHRVSPVLTPGVAQVAKVRGHVLHALRRGAVNLAARRQALDHGRVAGVVHLHVVGDKHVDLGRVNHRGDALEQLIGEGDLGRVDQRDLLVQDEIGVVGDAGLGSVAVELARVPVERANPVDVRLDLNCGKHGPSSKVWILARSVARQARRTGGRPKGRPPAWGSRRRSFPTSRRRRGGRRSRPPDAAGCRAAPARSR